jgi:hypothetical protein
MKIEIAINFAVSVCVCESVRSTIKSHVSNFLAASAKRKEMVIMKSLENNESKKEGKGKSERETCFSLIMVLRA